MQPNTITRSTNALEPVSLWECASEAKKYIGGHYGHAEADLFACRRDAMLSVLQNEVCIQPSVSERNLKIAGIVLVAVDSRAAYVPKRQPDMGQLYDTPRETLSVLDKMLLRGLIEIPALGPTDKVHGMQTFVPTDDLLGLIPEAGDFGLLLEKEAPYA